MLFLYSQLNTCATSTHHSCERVHLPTFVLSLADDSINTPPSSLARPSPSALVTRLSVSAVSSLYSRQLFRNDDLPFTTQIHLLPNDNTRHLFGPTKVENLFMDNLDHFE